MARSHCKAFTLVELMMAMAITAVIGVAVAGVAGALSTNYSQNMDYYNNVQSARSAMSYMRDSLRKAKLVTASSDDTIVLWLDANNNGRINNSEIRCWMVVSGELKELKIVYPSGMEALDGTVALFPLTLVAAVPALLQANAYKTWTYLAGNVTDFSVGVEPAAPLGRLVKLSLVCGDPGQAINLRTAVALRASSTALVSLTGGVYSLSVP
jgi:prepilin-type N-terminal cleavage/methylation domain-containing protein